MVVVSCVRASLMRRLIYDRSEATKLAAKTLNIEELPAFFIWKDGKMLIEYSGTNYDTIHHAVARSLGCIEDVG